MQMNFCGKEDGLGQGDSLADLIGNVDEAKAANPVAPPTNYKPKDFSEPCPKCGGDGHYHAPSNRGNRCFMCDGKGRMVFKTSPAARAKAKASSNARKAKKAAEIAAATAAAATAFRTANPELCAWVDAKAATFGFAASMQSAIAKWGSLTSGQIDAVKKLMVKDAERKAEAAARAEAAPAADQAGVDRLKLAFDTAIEYARAKGRGLKMPRITIGGMTISPAKATSSNPGALYVKNGGEYLGKVKDGRFFGARECTAAQEKQVLAFIADPKAAAIAYGIETGICCVCNAQLTNKTSIEAGIGPICATKFGW